MTDPFSLALRLTCMNRKMGDKQTGNMGDTSYYDCGVGFLQGMPFLRSVEAVGRSRP